MKHKKLKRSGGMRRPCCRCEKYFLPSSKGTRICERCIIKAHNERMEINRKKREKEQGRKINVT